MWCPLTEIQSRAAPWCRVSRTRTTDTSGHKARILILLETPLVRYRTLNSRGPAKNKTTVYHQAPSRLRGARSSSAAPLAAWPTRRRRPEPGEETAIFVKCRAERFSTETRCRWNCCHTSTQTRWSSIQAQNSDTGAAAKAALISSAS